MTELSDEDKALVIQREIFTEKAFKEKYGYSEPVETPLKERIVRLIRPSKGEALQAIKKYVLAVVPILHWLPKYRVKKWLVADIVSGLTIGILQIPQGMSYALLAGQHPIYGLYNAFLPVILYSILGTSRHTSMGTSSLTCLILGNAMASLAPDPVVVAGDDEDEAWDAVFDRRILLGSACMLLTGIFLLALSIIRAGSVVVYLSDPMISGFSCGVAIQILTLQLKGLLGLRIASYAGPLNLIWSLRDIILALMNMDDAQKTKTIATTVISIICLTFLFVVKGLNTRYKERIPLGLPLPGEITVVIVGTGVSYGVDLAEKYGIDVVGHIPVGIAAPVVPALNEFSSLVGYVVPIAIIGYSFSISTAKIVGNQFGYEIRPNQELVAYGVSNAVCSFFSCFPAFSSLSRSCVQAESGGETQVVGLVSSLVILFVLLVLGPLFSSLPKACLASVIFVALVGLFIRTAGGKSLLWKTSKLDFATWLVAALAATFLDVVYGLCVSVGFGLLCIVFRTQLAENGPLKRVGDTELYRKADRYSDMRNHDGVRVGAFSGPLIYVNKESFRRAVVTVAEIDPADELARRKIAEKKQDKSAAKKKKERRGKELRISEEESVVCSPIENEHTSELASEEACMYTENIPSNSLEYVVMDCAKISMIDSVGATVIAGITGDFKKIGVEVLLANCSSEIVRMLSASGYFLKTSEDTIFVSIHDAVTFSLGEIDKKKRGSEVATGITKRTQPGCLVERSHGESIM